MTWLAAGHWQVEEMCNKSLYWLYNCLLSTCRTCVLELWPQRCWRRPTSLDWLGTATWALPLMTQKSERSMDLWKIPPSIVFVCTIRKIYEEVLISSFLLAAQLINPHGTNMIKILSKSQLVFVDIPSSVLLADVSQADSRVWRENQRRLRPSPLYGSSQPCWLCCRPGNWGFPSLNSHFV